MHLIPRLEGQPKRQRQWWSIGKRVFWSCPTCGQAHELTTHKINEEGLVLPSVICEKCGFHAYVALEEVAPEVVNDEWGS